LIRHCKDIGMFALDRGRSTCKFSTEFCSERCYNNKFYTMNIGLDKRDHKNDAYWDALTSEQFKKELYRKRLSTKRFRFCTRGEPFSVSSDVFLIAEIAKACPQTDFWAPTRAWRNKALRSIIEFTLFRMHNVYITASVDPSNTQEEIDMLVDRGWSTHFFGNDEQYPFVVPSKIIKCPSKWHHSITCVDCNVACFNKQQTHSWLKEH